MQLIKEAVGLKQTNKPSDIALVQAALMKAKRGPNSKTPAIPYLAKYDGNYSEQLTQAIRAFQDEYQILPPPPKGAGAAVAATPSNAAEGIIRPNDSTWQKLVANVDTKSKEMRILDGGVTVYLPASDEDHKAKLNAASLCTFKPEFRVKLSPCIELMFKSYGIAVAVCPDGDRRTFQEQYNTLLRVIIVHGKPTHVSHAGPGESNHNFGMAADVGFRGLRWLKNDGAVVENEGDWLDKLEGSHPAEAAKFWAALRAVGTGSGVGLFRGPLADRPHLQNWDDAHVDMANRLADLLTKSGTMKWRGAHQRYTCDLGLGGDYYLVGTARQIWESSAAITTDALTKAWQAKADRDKAKQQPHPQAQPNATRAAGATAGVAVATAPALAQAALNPRSPVSAAATHPAQPPIPRATADDVKKIQHLLRQEFEKADANWQNWTPY